MKNSTRSEHIFSIVPAESTTLHNTFISFLANPIEHLLGLRQCQKIYQHIGHIEDPGLFMKQCLEVLDVHLQIDPKDKQKIPQKGACVVVCNHPFGAIEGVILADLLLSIRPDVKIMANFLLNRVPQLQNLTFAVDPFEGSGAAKCNVAPIRQAMRWVKQGGLLLVFPAGEVAHYKVNRREVSDPPWNNTVARIVRYAKASVVPIYIKGRNSTSFHIAGMLHSRLRTALLVREMFKKKGQTISLKIGNCISFRWLHQYEHDRRLMDYLRWRTYIMGHTGRQTSRLPILKGKSNNHQNKPLAAPQDSSVFRRDIEQLPPDQNLVQSGAFSVWYAKAAQVPNILNEIGRLREISFRSAGEGTGKPLDLDRFDAYYTHLFIWNETHGEIVGAYRLGRTDQILKKHGRKGLYTSTLFHSRMDFFNKIGPALEMGRSFIRSEYQRSYSSLLLLWKGIGAYIIKHPQYRMLFGPVSISSDYSDLSRQLLATTLLSHCQAKDLAMMVRPRKPAPLKPVRIRGCDRTSHDVQFQDFKEVCSVVSDIEIQQKDVPVLLRQYLNLGGQLLSFNIDKLFGSVMDGLIVVDLLQTDPKTLTRYMGTDGIAAFYAHHCFEKDSGDNESMATNLA